MPQCGYLVHNQKDEPNILNQLSLNSKNLNGVGHHTRTYEQTLSNH